MEEKPSKSVDDGPFYFNDTSNEVVTCDQIRAKCDHWSLGDNIKLISVLKNLSDDLVARSEEVNKKLDDVVHETEIKSVGVKNLINEFQMLADSQFIENRVYDEETTDLIVEDQKESVEESKEGLGGPAANQQILPVIQQCITDNLKFIDENFEFAGKLGTNQIESDEEEDFVNEALTRALQNNPFNRAPLPSLIGSQEFFNQSIFKTTEENIFDPRERAYEGENEARKEYISDASEDEFEENGDLFKPEPDDDTQSVSTRTSIQSGSRILSNVFSVTSNPEIGSINREIPEPVKDDSAIESQEPDESDNIFKVSMPPELAEPSKLLPNKLLDQVKSHIMARGGNFTGDDEDDLFKSDDEDDLFVVVKKTPTKQAGEKSKEKSEITESRKEFDQIEKPSETPSKTFSNAKNTFTNAQLIDEIKKPQRKSSLLSGLSEDDSDDFLFGEKTASGSANHSLLRSDPPVSQNRQTNEKPEKSSAFNPFSDFSDDSDSDNLFKAVPKKPPIAAQSSLSKASDEPQPIGNPHTLAKKLPSFLSDEDDDDDLFSLPKATTVSREKVEPTNILQPKPDQESKDQTNDIQPQEEGKTQTNIIQPKPDQNKKESFISPKLPTGAIRVLPVPSIQRNKESVPETDSSSEKQLFGEDDEDENDEPFSNLKSNTTVVKPTISSTSAQEPERSLPKLDYNSDDDDDLFSPSKPIPSKLTSSRPISKLLSQPSSSDEDLFTVPKANPVTIPPETSKIVENVPSQLDDITDNQFDEPVPGPAPVPKPRKSKMKEQEKKSHPKSDTSDEDLFKITSGNPISKESDATKEYASDDDFLKESSAGNLETQSKVRKGSLLESDSDSDDSLFGGLKPMPNPKVKENETCSKVDTSKTDSILNSLLSEYQKDTKASNYDWSESDSDDLFKPRK